MVQTTAVMLSAELPKFLWASNLLTFMNRVARPRATSSVLCMMLEGVGEGEVFHVNRQPSTAQQSKTTKVKQPSTKKSKKWTKCELSVKVPKAKPCLSSVCYLSGCIPSIVLVLRYVKPGVEAGEEVVVVCRPLFNT